MNASSNKNNKIIRYAFIGVAALYVAVLPLIWEHQTENHYWASLIKAIPVSLLAILAYLNTSGRTRKFIVPALIFSVGGDIALSLYWVGEPPPFVIGLGLFLIAHIFYIILFSKDATFDKSKLPWLLVVGAAALGMLIFLFPKLPSELLVPVIVYILVITTMMIMALLHQEGGKVLILGALLFMISDSMISFNTFVFEEPQLWAKIFIMVTYYAGQYFIVDAFLEKRA